MKRLGVTELLPQSVARAIADKTYERRKLAALEVETLIQSLAKQDQFGRIYMIVDTLATTYASPASGNANARKGGCLCLAAVAVALAGHPEAQSPEFISKVTPPVLTACTDADSRVRYYALEALYNISKSTRPAILGVFPEIFNILFRLCSDPDRSVQNAAAILDELMKTSIAADVPNFPLDAFLTKLTDCMAVDSSPQRLFLLGWISLIDGLPRADARLLRALPQLLPGMIDFLGDPAPEVQSAASKLLHQLMVDIRESKEDSGKVDFTALCAAVTEWLAENDPSSQYGDYPDDRYDCMNTDSSIGGSGSSNNTSKGVAIAWLQVLVAVAPTELGDQAPSLLKACLRCLDTTNTEIQPLGSELNDELLHAESLFEKADISKLLSTAAQGIGAMQESARLAALRWTALLLHKSSNTLSSNGESNQASSHSMLEPYVLPALCDALSSNSDKVVQEAVAVLAAVSGSGEQGCRRALASVLGCFRGTLGAKLLQRRGSAIIERLCQRMGAQRVLSTLADLISEEDDFDFSRLMAQAVSLMLLTSPDLEEARAVLCQTSCSPPCSSLDSDKNNSTSSIDFLDSLFPGLSCSVAAALSVAFLAGAYPLAADIISKLTQQPLIADMGASIVELGQVVSLLEAPVFAGLRLQLLAPHRHPGLLQALHSLLLVLPQGEAFRMLKQRLECIPVDRSSSIGDSSGGGGGAVPLAAAKEEEESRFERLLSTFVDVQTRKLLSNSTNNATTTVS